MRIFIAVVGLGVVGFFGFQAVDRSVAVGQIPDEVGPNLNVIDLLDWDVLYRTLSDADFADDVADQFDSGRVCKFLGVDRDSESGGDIDYVGNIAFTDTSSTVPVLDWLYEKDSSSGSNPAIPPDTLSYDLVDMTNPTGLQGVLLSEQVSFDWLVEVLENPPSMVGTMLSSKDLTELWVEKDSSSPPTYTLFLKFTTSTSSTTKRVWATYENGSFGTMYND